MNLRKDNLLLDTVSDVCELTNHIEQAQIASSRTRDIIKETGESKTIYVVMPYDGTYLREIREVVARHLVGGCWSADPKQNRSKQFMPNSTKGIERAVADAYSGPRL